MTVNFLTAIRRLVIVCMSCAIALGAAAQTQQGYVKTLGKPLKKGKALSGVTVRVKGEHNAVVSQKDGKFSIPMPGKKSGDAYTLQQVHKNGFELNDQSMIGRKFAFSTNVPLTVVMVSTEDLQADKLRIENNAYRAAERNYQAKVAELEKKLKKNIISTEQYQTEIQDLQDKFERYQSLIESLADHYAHTDYDELTSNEAEVNLLIEAGELEKADSLIHTMFDPIDVLQRNQAALTGLNQTIDNAQSLIDQANADLAAVLKQQDRDAEHLYQLYTIALAQFDNKKASRYIQIRAELDDTNIEWQNDAGKFICDYMADYSRALEYYQRVFTLALQQDGEQCYWCATAYNNIGEVYESQGNHDTALQYFQKALKIRKSIFGESHLDVAMSYNNIGVVYCDIEDYDTALQYFQKALEIQKAVLGESHPDVALSYNNIGVVYGYQNNYDTALQYHQKALEIQKTVLGENHPSVALSYNNIGYVYDSQGDEDTALRYVQKALEIQKAVLGENHPKIALSFYNIGWLYFIQGDSTTALQYFQKAMEIRKAILGENHPDVVADYLDISKMYELRDYYATALQYLQKALEIQKAVLGENHLDVAASYYDIGEVYESQDDYATALQYLQKALEIRKAILGENHPDVKETEEAIDIVKSEMSQGQSD